MFQWKIFSFENRTRFEFKYQLMDRVKGDMGRVTVNRAGFPLEGAFAVTIHKCQGETVNRAIVDLNFFGPSQSHAAYVALSRLKCSANLHILSRFKRSVLEMKKSIDYQMYILKSEKDDKETKKKFEKGVKIP